MWIMVGTAGVLTVLGIWDARTKSVPLGLVAASGILAAAVGLRTCMQGEQSVWEILLSVLPGALLLLTAFATGKAGTADGVIVMALGAVVGCRGILILFTASLILLSFYSMALLALRKVKRDTRLPYLPFLCLVYLIYEGVTFGG